MQQWRCRVRLCLQRSSEPRNGSLAPPFRNHRPVGRWSWPEDADLLRTKCGQCGEPRKGSLASSCRILKAAGSRHWPVDADWPLWSRVACWTPVLASDLAESVCMFPVFTWFHWSVSDQCLKRNVKPWVWRKLHDYHTLSIWYLDGHGIAFHTFCMDRRLCTIFIWKLH
jgi:hypothetical protein